VKAIRFFCFFLGHFSHVNFFASCFLLHIVNKNKHKILTILILTRAMHKVIVTFYV
jgi:hypothetical protein